MLTNAVAGGVLIATYLVVLVLQLNPQLPIFSMTAWRWLRTIVALYGLYLTVGLYLVLLVREALASRPLQPAWLSVRLLAWVSAIGAGTAAALTWANLKGFYAVLGDAAAEAMRRGASATTTFAVVLLAIALLRYSFGRRGSPAAALLLVASCSGPSSCRCGCAGPGDLPVPSVRRSHRLRLRWRVDAARPHDPARRRVARLHPPARRARAAAEFRPPARPRRHDRSGDAEAHGGRARVGGGGHRQISAENGVRSDAIYRVGADDDEPVTLLPDLCFARSLVLQSFIREDRD